MYLLEFTIDGRIGVSAKDIRAARKETLYEVGEEYLETIIARHFTPTARNVYGYESRGRIYTQVTKREEGVGKGKSAYLVLSGRSERAARHLSRIVASSRKVTIHLSGLPGYFKNPYVGPVRDKDGNVRFTIRRQPDKVKELKTYTGEEMNRVARNSAERLSNRLAARAAQ